MNSSRRQSFIPNYEEAEFKPNTGTSLFFFLITFGSYLVTFQGILSSRFEPVRWLLVFFNGFIISVLVILAHDIAHQSFFPSKRLNDFFGRIAFLPAYMPYTAWCYEHHGVHHRYTNWVEKDPNWAPLSYQAFCALPGWRRLLERFYKSPFGLGVWWIIEYWWKRHMVPPEMSRKEMKKRGLWSSFRRDIMTVFLFFLGQCIYVASCQQDFSSSFSMICTAIFMPHLVYTYLIGLITFLQHISPSMVWYSSESEWKKFSNQSLTATNIKMPFFLDKLLFNVPSHSAHHTNMNIPGYRLARRQKQLEEIYQDRMSVETFSIPWMVSIFSKCQLYDFDKHQWLDFNGNPTTPAIDLNRQLSASQNTRVAA